MNRLIRWLLVLTAMSLAACGGGGGSSPTPPSPGSISYPAQSPFTVFDPIPTITPSVTGTVSNYSVSPQLPDGVSINSATGAISGTPTVVLAATTYTVSATSAGINVSAPLSLTVRVRPPFISYPKASWQYVIDQRIPFMDSQVDGVGPVTLSISPALPSGLMFDTTNGRVSGTPTIGSPQTGYTVTAHNDGGDYSTTLVLWVLGYAPGIQYPESTYSLVKGSAVSILPRLGKGPATWTVNPALPGGLTFDPATGAISGTPTTVTAQANYTISGTNPDGTATLQLSLSVVDSPLLDLGHADSVVALLHDGENLLSLDGGRHATLWNATTGAILATRDDVVADSGSSGCSNSTLCLNLLGLAGTTAVVQSERWLIVLDTTNGAQVAQLQLPDSTRWWQLSRDGSYLVAASNTALTAWSRTGTLLFTKTANYGNAKAFPANNQLRIGGGPAGAAIIEKITVPGGVSSSSGAHQGTFHSWFDDGEKFISTVGNTLWVYSKDVAQLDFTALPDVTGLTGQGNWFWTHPTLLDQIEIYAVGASSTPAAAFPLSPGTTAVASGGTIGLLPYGTNTMSVVDLSGGTPIKNDYAGPTHDFGAYGAASKNDWAVGALFGVVLGEFTTSTQRYSYGQALSIAANEDDIVVATASGHILDFNANTRALKRDIEYAASKVELSADGTRVIAAPTISSNLYAPLKNLRVYSLASGAVLNEWTYPSGGHLLIDFDVAAAADALTQVVDTNVGTTPQRIVTTLGGTPIWSSSAIDGASFMYLSPDGTLSAIAANGPASSAGTNIYTSGTLSGAVPGVAAGWFDNARLVVNRYQNDKYGIPVFDHVDVINTTGAVQSSPAIGPASSIQVATANSFYVPDSNKVVDATNGTLLFSSPSESRGTGAVAGSNVVFASGSAVRIEPL
jgi:hypothetical protein